MIQRRMLQLVGIALLAAACTSTGGTPVSQADRCFQEGGRWIAVLETCDKAAAGGGGGGY